MRVLLVTPAFNPPHGGLRIVNEWANRLTKWHDVSIHSLKRDQCNWFPLSSEVKVQPELSLAGMDCLVICSPHGVHLLNSRRLPGKVFMFMQMMEHLFRPGDNAWQKMCKQFYTAPYPLIGISEWNARDLREKFGRESRIEIVGNGVNFDHFPIEPDVAKEEDLVLVEGWENTNPSKDTDGIVINVARRLRGMGYRIAAYSHLPLKRSPESVDEYHYQPTLSSLNGLYRRAAILLKASKYDARACAPVEAMTKGTVTARAITEGDDDLNENNSIRVSYNTDDLYKAAIKLLRNKELRQQLSGNCLRYVRDECCWDKQMERINGILCSS